MYSGFGEVTGEDLQRDPVTVLDDHAKAVRQWLEQLCQKDLLRQTIQASKNPFFDQYQSQKGLTGKSCGTIAELCEFDVWLKKLALSEKKPAQPANRTPTPPAHPKPAAAPAPKPHIEPKAPAALPKPKAKPDDGSALPVLTREQQAAYNKYWKKYSNNKQLDDASQSPATTVPSSESHAPSPCASPNASPVAAITPKRLDMGSSPQGLPWLGIYCVFHSLDLSFIIALLY